MEISKNGKDLQMINKEIDFVIPLKQVGLLTRAVFEAISRFYAPRTIYIVSSATEILLLKSFLPKWDINQKLFAFLIEEEFFIPNFNLTLKQIKDEYDMTRGGDQREPGWWIQQLIKLGAATQIPEISSHYVGIFCFFAL